jgi:Protein of unknown function (DUF2846).
MSSCLRNIAFVVMAFAALPVSGAMAADTNTYATLHASEPAIADGQGRIYFYRESGLLGLTVQPSIYIDGVATGGSSKPGDYFYVDKPAGTYLVSTTTEKKESVSVTVVAGQPVYVKTSVSMGFFVGHVSPEVIAPAKAEAEIKNCDYTPPKTAPAAATPSAPATAPAAAPATAPAAAPTAAPTAAPASDSAAGATPSKP